MVPLTGLHIKGRLLALTGNSILALTLLTLTNTLAYCGMGLSAAIKICILQTPPLPLTQNLFKSNVMKQNFFVIDDEAK